MEILERLGLRLKELRNEKNCVMKKIASRRHGGNTRGNAKALSENRIWTCKYSDLDMMHTGGLFWSDDRISAGPQREAFAGAAIGERAIWDRQTSGLVR